MMNTNTFAINTIGRHTFTVFNHEAAVSTIQLEADLFETLVYFTDDGEELECHRTRTLADAKRTHNAVMNRWNDRIYNGSVAKMIGFPNIGQFMHPVITC